MSASAALRFAPLVALVAGALLGCFHADVFAYAPCEGADGCAEAGLGGCLRLPDDPTVRGTCTAACGPGDDCPDPPSGDASPRCAEVDGGRVCVLSCMDEETCPQGQVCRDVTIVGDEVMRLCFPESDP